MSQDQSQDGKFELARVDEGEFKVGIRVPATLYVFMESEKKYLPFVTLGEILTDHKWKTLQKLKGRNVFVKDDPLRSINPFDEALSAFSQNCEKNIGLLQQDRLFVGDAMAQESQILLNEIFKEMMTLPPNYRSDDIARTLAMISEKVVDTLLADTRDVRKKLLVQLQHLHLMNDSAAITTLAVLFAIANDFTSKSTTKILALAALFCDAGLADLEKNWYDMYYREPQNLPSHISEKIKMHPLKSQQMVAYSNLGTEILSQVILTHHELSNGQGFHRAVQNGTLPAIAQIFSLAVDTFGKIKYLEAHNRQTTMVDLFRSLDESAIEASKRRHNIKWVKALYRYLGIV